MTMFIKGLKISFLVRYSLLSHLFIVFLNNSINFGLDFFRGPKAEAVRLQGLEHVIQFTVIDGKIHFRSFKVLLKKSGSKLPRVELDEIGPRMDLTLRRHKLASDGLFKLARKQPKQLKVNTITQEI